MKLAILAIALALASPGCSKWTLDSYWTTDGYRLIAIDARSQMSLIAEESGLGLVGPTVFAVGEDGRYIVLKQHPASDLAATTFDRATTHYYLVEKRAGTAEEKRAGVRGPMTKEEYEQLAQKLSLPPFAKSFPDLE